MKTELKNATGLDGRRLALAVHDFCVQEYRGNIARLDIDTAAGIAYAHLDEFKQFVAARV